MTYCNVSEVYGATNLTSSEITENHVLSSIKAAEATVDRLSNTTYWSVEETGTATAGASSTLTDTDNFEGEDYSGMYVWIYGGTGSGQMRQIVSNTDDVLTVDRDWDTNPSTDSTYRIIYTNRNPYISEELRDGDDTDTLFVDRYPLRILETVEIDDTDITNSYIYQYKDTGKLVLSSSAEESAWTSKKAQKNVLSYWYGVYPIDWEIKRLTIVYAGLFILQAQMGGTHNIPSTYSLPEGSLTIGQAYINIKGTWDTLMQEKKHLESLITKYAYIFA